MVVGITPVRAWLVLVAPQRSPDSPLILLPTVVAQERILAAHTQQAARLVAQALVDLLELLELVVRVEKMAAPSTPVSTAQLVVPDKAHPLQVQQLSTATVAVAAFTSMALLHQHAVI
jgi:hypothetical protein